MDMEDLFNRSIEHKAQFWKEQAGEIRWTKFPEQILTDGENGYPQWFADGELNICHLCIDQHIEDGFGDQPAVIYDSPVTGKKSTYTFSQAKEEISKLAGGLISLGFKERRYRCYLHADDSADPFCHAGLCADWRDP
ncbi:hypothetical protein QE403_000898 [Chryseobacterium sp. SORGH_AS 1048]|nr:hypothetical protein [Chryseobacterium sp. SORGH_AS_1048]